MKCSIKSFTVMAFLGNAPFTIKAREAGETEP